MEGNGQVIFSEERTAFGGWVRADMTLYPDGDEPYYLVLEVGGCLHRVRAQDLFRAVRFFVQGGEE